jgi:hypothetical protein
LPEPRLLQQPHEKEQPMELNQLEWVNNEKFTNVQTPSNDNVDMMAQRL